MLCALFTCTGTCLWATLQGLQNFKCTEKLQWAAFWVGWREKECLRSRIAPVSFAQRSVQAKRWNKKSQRTSWIQSIFCSAMEVEIEGECLAGQFHRPRYLFSHAKNLLMMSLRMLVKMWFQSLRNFCIFSNKKELPTKSCEVPTINNRMRLLANQTTCCICTEICGIVASNAWHTYHSYFRVSVHCLRRFVTLRVKSLHQNGTFVLNTGLMSLKRIVSHGMSQRRLLKACTTWLIDITSNLHTSLDMRNNLWAQCMGSSCSPIPACNKLNQTYIKRVLVLYLNWKEQH